MSLAELAASNGLHRVGARPRLWHYLKQTAERLDFATAMAMFRLRSELEDNRLGILWLVLRPALNAAVYGLVFGLLQAGRRPADYTSYVVIGVFLFEFFQQSFVNGAKSITGNRALVQSLSFPRLTLPVALVIEKFLALLPALALMLVFLPTQGHWPRLTWLLMIPLLAIYTVFNLGIAMIGARLTVHVRDLTQLLPFVTRLLFYTSGVLFAVDRIFEDHPSVVHLYNFHPIYQMLEISRGVLMDRPYIHEHWAWFSASAVVVFVTGLLFFWVAEERYGRD